MFTLTIRTDNAAFTDDPDELSRLLRKVAYRVEGGETSGRISDSNGNTVGQFENDDDPDDDPDDGRDVDTAAERNHGADSSSYIQALRDAGRYR